MRHIDLRAIKPRIRHLLDNLARIQEEVINESDPKKRDDLIDRNRRLWVAFREAFDRHSYGKCWYVECKNPGTDDDIDHFRPKGAIDEEPGHPGYYWLAFEWENYRLSCHRANRPRENPETRTTGGKSDHFPLINPSKRAWKRGEEGNEHPTLLDPTNLWDTRILSFNIDGSIDVSPEFIGNQVAEIKIATSKIYLHLDWPTFRNDRKILYNKIERIVDRANRIAPKSLVEYETASNEFTNLIIELQVMIQPDQPYSRAAYLYIKSFKHLWWVQQVVLEMTLNWVGES